MFGVYLTDHVLYGSELVVMCKKLECGAANTVYAVNRTILKPLSQVCSFS